MSDDPLLDLMGSGHDETARLRDELERVRAERDRLEDCFVREAELRMDADLKRIDAARERDQARTERDAVRMAALVILAEWRDLELSEATGNPEKPAGIEAEYRRRRQLLGAGEGQT